MWEGYHGAARFHTAIVYAFNAREGSVGQACEREHRRGTDTAGNLDLPLTQTSTSTLLRQATRLSLLLSINAHVTARPPKCPGRYVLLRTSQFLVLVW